MPGDCNVDEETVGDENLMEKVAEEIWLDFEVF
jgi:hypothetical protein